MEKWSWVLISEQWNKFWSWIERTKIEKGKTPEQIANTNIYKVKRLECLWDVFGLVTGYSTRWVCRMLPKGVEIMQGGLGAVVEAAEAVDEGRREYRDHGQGLVAY